MTEKDSNLRALAGLMVASGVIALLIGWDLLSDYAEGVDLIHILVESLVLVISAGLFVAVVVAMNRSRRQLERTRITLASACGESRRWRDRYRDTLRGLGAAIEDQFQRWKLSSAESEIALFLLKGMSLKEIAGARGTGERTVREQARAVYRKAGLNNRSELAAFFLEDLLLPHSASPAVADSEAGSGVS